ncbi:MAG: ABC transporter ATP-binding protein [Verrucomicrobia bacterium]|nr:ABC transporter ATP-binding protein [Verrucomicrobiota bacterium]
MLEARKLTKRFGDHLALDSLSLSIPPGEILCLLGANGAGKTTTINLFLGFLQPDSGSALVDGVDVDEDCQAARHRLAYIPEQVTLYRNLTGVENLQYFAGLSGRKLTRDELHDYLNKAGLPKTAVDRNVGTYSKGMRQKVGIAIAMAKQAKALLLDEPTSGLDPKASNEFSNLIKQVSKNGVAVLMATHDLFNAKELATRIGIMKSGKLVETLDPEAITHRDLERIYLQHMHA